MHDARVNIIDTHQLGRFMRLDREGSNPGTSVTLHTEDMGNTML
jgi:hypothetical protein